VIYYQKYPEVERIDTEDILVFRKPGGAGLVDAVVSSPLMKVLLACPIATKRQEQND